MRIRIFLLSLSALFLLCFSAFAQEETIDSPRIAALDKELKAGNKTALENFWTEMAGKAPLVEAIPGDEKFVWVTYLWEGNAETHAISMAGGAPANEQYFKALHRLGDSNLWYRTDKVPRDARYTYVFMLNPFKVVLGDKELEQKIMKHSRRDPLNPRTFMFPPNAAIVELPDAPPQAWLKPLPDVPRGETKQESFKSAILGEDRPIKIYTPPAAAAGSKPPALLIYLDGEVVPFAVPLATILDNLIAKDKIQPTVAVMVSSGKTRSRDLGCSPKFAEFLAKELVPDLRRRFKISEDPKQVAISGFSLGGLTAAYVGMRHSDVIGNVLSQSGSYWFYEGWTETSPESAFVESGWLAKQFATLPKLPLRFYLEVGRLEQGFPINMVLENRRMRDTLVARGYPVTYAEYSGGHDVLCWRGSVADGLMALFGKQK